MTLAQEKKFKPQTQDIKVMSYNVVMHNPRLAKDSVETIKQMFKKADLKKKRDIVKMLEFAAAIAMDNAKDFKKFSRINREKIFEIAIMYKELKRDLESELKEMERFQGGF